MDKIDLFNEIFEKTGLNPNRLNYLKKDLIERDKHLNGQLEKVRQWHKERNTDPIGCPEVKILTNSIIQNEIQLRMIGDELSRLEREKAQNNTNGGNGGKSGENRVLAYNNNVENSLKKIELILKDVNTLLFVDSTPKQWEQILNLETLTTPIIVKNEIALNGLSKFFEALSIIGVFKKQWQTKLSLLNAFKHNTEFITADQFKHALNDGKSNGTAIDRDLQVIFIGLATDEKLNKLLSAPIKHKF